VLDALDGLDGDADVAFVMTTNRVSVLERALADRPGRVDLAVEVPLPGLPERTRLFRRYAGALPFSDEVLAQAAERAEGTTGSFAKELMRRSVLGAAMRGGEPSDADLLDALESLLTSRSALTRKLLGTRGDEDEDDDGIEPEDVVDFAFVAGPGEPGFPVIVPAKALDALDGEEDEDEDEDDDEDDGRAR
jgi:SpoVK/Ycf46/Vps4 family AAA+-type ATPase